MFLEQLGNNLNMMDSLRAAFSQKMPIFAECGGFMYLTETIRDFSDRLWPGVGIIPAEVAMTNQLAALGYVEATAVHDSIITRKGDILRGHEFHYSQLSGVGAGQSPFALRGGMGRDNRGDGYVQGNLLASYVHLHLRSNPQAAQNFVDVCRKYQSGQQSLI
jgi:cobyrinic acid a,c-diamide synthase